MDIAGDLINRGRHHVFGGGQGRVGTIKVQGPGGTVKGDQVIVWPAEVATGAGHVVRTKSAYQGLPGLIGGDRDHVLVRGIQAEAAAVQFHGECAGGAVTKRARGEDKNVRVVDRPDVADGGRSNQRQADRPVAVQPEAVDVRRRRHHIRTVEVHREGLGRHVISDDVFVIEDQSASGPPAGGTQIDGDVAGCGRRLANHHPDQQRGNQHKRAKHASNRRETRRHQNTIPYRGLIKDVAQSASALIAPGPYCS